MVGRVSVRLGERLDTRLQAMAQRAERRKRMTGIPCFVGEIALPAETQTGFIPCVPGHLATDILAPHGGVLISLFGPDDVRVYRLAARDARLLALAIVRACGPATEEDLKGVG